MSDKKNEMFAMMYGKMDQPKTPEKITGRPVSRSSREHLEALKRGQS